MNTDKNSETIRWNRIFVEIAKMKKEDEAIAHVFYWAGRSDETIDMPSFGTKLIPKEQAIQYGPEVLAYWSRWNELNIKDGILYKKTVSARWLDAKPSDDSSSGRTEGNS